ncbi:putative E3 ubiquitin-protein ligase [Scheffersomyces spartinae]|uniref:HECT-type E3 ubiquitin transferase n=1 Tax=Scheffersomyces spartinae TaxID=45513 RepID=A0A9P7VAH5_9ASCO|nr:putative E3 ubiquitin-protein ligase [Scheffersomyces spartinae]KAG7194441.1 putative E3 ubiquitin-protein ligase [Scheffersomyces spartinae]
MPLFRLFGAKEGPFHSRGSDGGGRRRGSGSSGDEGGGVSPNGARSRSRHTGTGTVGSSSGSDPMPHTIETVVVSCACCGVFLTYRLDTPKFRCYVCHTTHLLRGGDSEEDNGAIEALSYEYVKRLILNCLSTNEGTPPAVGPSSLHETLHPVLSYLYLAFRNKKCLNDSFPLASASGNVIIDNINSSEMLMMFQMLTRLPTKRPLYKALSGACECLKRIPLAFSDDPKEHRWLLVLLEIPFLDHAVMINREKYATSMISNPEIKALTYEIFKRAVGLLAHIKSVKVANSFAISKEDDDTINRTSSLKTKKKNQNPKIRIQQYNNDWLLKTAAIVMSLFYRANKRRDEMDALPCSNFYNSLVDFVNMRIDFDAWQLTLNDSEATAATSALKDSQPEELRNAIKYITGKLTFELDSFFFCQYPLLISLGNKIGMLEYEAHRQMERKAEEAFINSLDKRITFEVYFRVQVRREYIVQDSLRCIEQNEKNLKKSLKVTFIGEPGIDAGGLRKEWFLLLTRLLFRPIAGMISYVELSNYVWFNMIPQEDCQMYYLLGAVLGLAIYNSVILDLKFPKSFYKLLLNETVGFNDFKELQPEIASNLLKLTSFNEEELKLMELKFELDLHDEIFKENDIKYQLIPNGSNVSVDKGNVNLYIKKYYQFYMGEGIYQQLQSFRRGFNSVVGGNALSLFDAEEIQLMLCGSDDGKIDLTIWQSITKYTGGFTKESPIIVWLWEYLEGLSNSQQKKFLLFVTGSDRIPATGIQNLSFKVTRLGSNSNRLPIAHTCFNELCLYEYSTSEKLIQKLQVAFNESAGFGIK